MADVPTFTIVPATPGFSVGYLPDDAIAPFLVHSDAIVAWRIETYWNGPPAGQWRSSAYPITAADEPSGSYAIIEPNGRVVFPGDCSCDSIEEAESYLAAQRAAPTP